MKKTIAILLVVVMALSLAACSKSKDAKKDGKKNENTIVGTWELDLDATFADQDQDTLDFLKSSGYSMSFTFNADGTGTAKMTGDDDTSFEYKIENNQIVIEDEGVDYTLNGDKLTLDMNGEKMIFNRK